MDEILLDNIEKECKSLSLLYVEDNAQARHSTLLILNEFFDNIEIAVDGKDGYEKFKSGNFSLIMTDINMPKMSGLEMLKEIRKIDLSIPAIVLSAYNEQNYFTDGIKMGIDGYLLKPIDIEQFVDIMGRVIEHIKLRRENEAYKTKLESMVRTQTKEIEAKAKRLYFQALTDQLTGLYNSAMLSQLLKKGEHSFLIYLDLVNFTTINKQYGKKFSNDILKETAKALEANLRKNMRIFKIESDRFAILCANLDKFEVIEFSKQLIAFFDMTNLHVNSNEININFTIGAAEITADNDILMECEYALDWAKRIGRRTYYVYEQQSAPMQDEQETIKWLNITKRLIVEDKIEPYYQAIYDLKTDEIVKYEVLARAIDDDKVYSPYLFLTAAERLGLLSSITKIIVNKSFSFFSKNSYHFSINITEKDLLEDGFYNFLVEKSNYYNIEPSRVTCEILEGITMANSSNIIVEKLNAIREYGFLLAVDDFGVENSNFSRLLEIELDFIKIDGIFIKNIANSKKDENIVRAIVNLAKTLDIKTVAEFVENQEIMDKIIECGIDYAQGYHIGKPHHELMEKQ